MVNMADTMSLPAINGPGGVRFRAMYQDFASWRHRVPTAGHCVA